MQSLFVWDDVECVYNTTCGVCALPRDVPVVASPTSLSSALPTCGTRNDAPEFALGDRAGCLCERADKSRFCIGGQWSTNDTVIARPFAEWKFDRNNTVVFDSSGNGFHGRVVGVPGVDFVVRMEENISFASFRGAAYVDFGDFNGFQFGTRDFVIAATIRLNATSNSGGFLVSHRRDCKDTGYWQLYMNPLTKFEIGRPDDYALITATGSTTTLFDLRWHVIRVVRKNGWCNVFVDDVPLLGSAKCAYYIGGTNLLVGAVFCTAYGTPEFIFKGDIAKVSIFVDTLPGSLCSVRASDGYDSSSLSAFQSFDCDRVVGFCRENSADDAWQCCAAIGCAECSQYRSCSSQFSMSTTLSTCGTRATPEFAVGDRAGCLCERADKSRSCILGQWSQNDTVVARPLADWRLNQNSSTAFDSSSNAFHSRFSGIAGKEYTFKSDTSGALSSYTSFNGSCIDFGDLRGFEFGARDFSVEASVRFSLVGIMVIVANRGDPSLGYWVLYVNGGLYFEIPGLGIAASPKINDNQWHVVRAQRIAGYCDLFVDNVHRNGGNCFSFVRRGNPLTIGGQYYPQLGTLVSSFIGDIANVSIYVDKFLGSLCQLNSTGAFVNSNQTAECSRIVGFCSANNNERQPCCGSTDCIECDQYRTCSIRSSSTSSKSLTTLSSSSSLLTTFSSSSSSTTLSLTTVKLPVSSLSSSSTVTYSTEPTTVSTTEQSFYSSTTAFVVAVGDNGPTFWIVVASVCSIVCFGIGALAMFFVLRRRQRSKQLEQQQQQHERTLAIQNDAQMKSAYYSDVCKYR